MPPDAASGAGGAAAAFGLCPVPATNHARIVLAHGSGGLLTQRLIEETILPAFRNPLLEPLHDGAVCALEGARLAFSTDSFVVSPIFFPGGDIGSLAVHGTVNDLAMCGAEPLYLSAAFILEEGLAMEDFRRVLRSMADAAAAAGVKLVTGDTKVVDRGKGDQMFITTAGIGRVRGTAHIDPRRAVPGDKVIVSGPIAVHGIAIMSVREGLEFETVIESDTAPLHGLAAALLDAVPDVRVLRDPTRGGLAGALAEIARQSGAGIRLDEAAIPVGEEVKAACELLGLDPLYVANEGKLVAIVPAEAADAAVAALRAHPLGRGAAAIGEAVSEPAGVLTMRTRVGGMRIVPMLAGEQLPRIC